MQTNTPDLSIIAASRVQGSEAKIEYSLKWTPIRRTT